MFRRFILWVFGMIGGEKALKTLISALRDEDRKVRKTALRALEKISSDWFRSNEAKKTSS
ncbi:MAG: HEAT repeat domain-containing protein [Candidatus Kryptonium sp.]